MDPVLLSTVELAAACTRETQNYLHRRPHDDNFCFELFRRALLSDNTEALNALFMGYKTLLMGWVLKHELFTQADEDPHFLASHAFWNFYFAIRGEKFLNFSALPQLLKYLAACVHSVVETYARQRRHTTYIDDDNLGVITFDEKLDTNLERQQFWQRIKVLLPETLDRRLIHLRYVEGLTPVDIVTRFPEYWPNVRSVTVHLQRLMRKLFQDPELRTYVNKITRKRS